MTWNDIIWHQFGAAIDMLDNAIQACPDALWKARLYDEREVHPEFAEFWYLAYHALFWLDFYLSETAVNFAPPAPFTLAEFEAGLLPERVYTKGELLGYLRYGRNKCKTTIDSIPNFMAPQRVRTDWPEMSIAEMMLYNMRHVQEHAAQLSLFLGQKAIGSSGWVPIAQNTDSSEQS